MPKPILPWESLSARQQIALADALPKSLQDVLSLRDIGKAYETFRNLQFTKRED